jgi:hypothetical protein
MMPDALPPTLLFLRRGCSAKTMKLAADEKRRRTVHKARARQETREPTHIAGQDCTEAADYGHHNETPLLNGGNSLLAGGGFRRKAAAWPFKK